MLCCVPFCKTTAEIVSESSDVTFHSFPSEVHFRAAWLKALGELGNLPLSAVVCSNHFLDDDICKTESGLRQIRSGAVPTTVQVCMICLDTHSKLLMMSKYKLDEVYQHLMGQEMSPPGNLKPTLCVQCAQRLVNFSKFRDKSLRAQAVMTELVDKQGMITILHLDTLNEMNGQLKYNIAKTVLEPDHCDLHINIDADKQTHPSPAKGTVTVKREVSSPLPEDLVPSQPDTVMRNSSNAESFNINLVVTKEEYISDEEPGEFTDPLLVQPSTSKESTEPLAHTKYEISFECSICSKEFVDEDTYNVHVHLHTMEHDQEITEAKNPSEETSEPPGKWKLPLSSDLDNLIRAKTRGRT